LLASDVADVAGELREANAAGATAAETEVSRASVKASPYAREVETIAYNRTRA
jgi:hypothetical protein